jgi:hypothetical protein
MVTFEKPSQSGPPLPNEAKSLQHWARVYAQNRSLGVVVNLCIFVLLCVLIGGGSLLTGYALLKGRLGLLILGISADLLSVGALIWLSVPRWGGRWQERMVSRLYAKEGQVSLQQSGRKGPCRMDIAVGIAFGACVIASVELGFWLNWPLKYMQPISATYGVPFMLYLGWRMRPAGGWAMLLWPVLYALHAVLIVTGVPIVWSPPWDGLNMLIPVAGYGILAGLIGHLCSRRALRKLRALAGDPDPTATADTEGSGDE